MTFESFAREVHAAVTYLLADVVTPERVANTIRHLDVGDDLLLPSTAEIKTQLAWQDLIQWLDDEGRLLEEYPLEMVDGICGAQAHTWIEVHTTVHDFDRDPVRPVFIIDAVPPGVVGGPLLIGPSSPLRLCYAKRTKGKGAK